MSGASSSSDIPKLNLYYHPNCKASNKLLNTPELKSDGNKLFNFIDIGTLGSVPRQIQRIPCIDYDNKIVYGRECFDLVARLLIGPTSCNVYTTGSKVCSFDNKNTEYDISPSFSSVGNNNNTDGFKGVPTYTGDK